MTASNRFILERTLQKLIATLPNDVATWLMVPPNSIHLFETVTSTNQVAWELLQQKTAEVQQKTAEDALETPTGTVVIALSQTAGRGQRGHQWNSLLGGLYLSLAFMPDLPVNCGSHLTLCSAWGVASALRQHNVPVEIKWLNDLVVAGRKLGGILTETRIAQQRLRQTVIGVGINWQNPVPETGINLQSVLASQTNQPDAKIQSLEMLAAIVVYGLVKGYVCYRQQGIEALLCNYHSLLTNMNQLITVEGAAGQVVGVSSQGKLRVKLTAAEFAASEIELQPGEFSLGYG